MNQKLISTQKSLIKNSQIPEIIEKDILYYDLKNNEIIKRKCGIKILN
jgi:hypothetical protein